MAEATIKVLIVDDESSLLYALKRCLRNRFEVDTALGATAALASIVQNGPYAVVVTDLQMAGMDGIELLSRVADIAPATTRVVLSGSSDRARREAAFKRGQAFAFLSKPCELEDVAACLERGIDHHRNQKIAPSGVSTGSDDPR